MSNIITLVQQSDQHCILDRTASHTEQYAESQQASSTAAAWSIVCMYVLLAA